jgi:hypothetical protein
MADETESGTELKRQIRELRTRIAAAIGEKKSGEVKKLRRQVKRLKRETRKRAAAKKAQVAAPASPPEGPAA